MYGGVPLQVLHSPREFSWNLIPPSLKPSVRRQLRRASKASCPCLMHWRTRPQHQSWQLLSLWLSNQHIGETICTTKCFIAIGWPSRTWCPGSYIYWWKILSTSTSTSTSTKIFFANPGWTYSISVFSLANAMLLQKSCKACTATGPLGQRQYTIPTLAPTVDLPFNHSCSQILSDSYLTFISIFGDTFLSHARPIPTKTLKSHGCRLAQDDHCVKLSSSTGCSSSYRFMHCPRIRALAMSLASWTGVSAKQVVAGDHTPFLVGKHYQIQLGVLMIWFYVSDFFQTGILLLNISLIVSLIG